MLLGLIYHGRIQGADQHAWLYCLRRTKKLHGKFSKRSKIIIKLLTDALSFCDK